MNLLKASFYSFFSTVFRILAGLIIAKVVSVYVGPAGLGKMGQFMSLMTLMTVLAGGGLSNGIIRYVAEYREKTSKLYNLLGNAVTYTLLCCCTAGILGVVFSKQLAYFLLGSTSYSSIIIFLAFAQFFIAANNFLVAIVNGFKEIKRVTLINCIGTLVGLLLAVLLIMQWQLYGALLALIIMQAVLCFVSFGFCYQAEWFNFNFFFPRLSKKNLIRLAQFSLMSITTAIITPVAQIIVRNHIAHVFSWSEVGYWQAITRISDAYLMVITTGLTGYYLPRLAEIKLDSTLKNEILKSYKIILPLVTLAALIIYIGKKLIIYTLFDGSFLPMINLFAFQLIGDVLKIGAWMLSFLMLAKKMTSLFIITEIIFNTSLVIFSFLFVYYFGLIGLTYAFALNCFIYWITMGITFRKVFISNRQVN